MLQLQVLRFQGRGQPRGGKRETCPTRPGHPRASHTAHQTAVRPGAAFPQSLDREDRSAEYSGASVPSLGHDNALCQHDPCSYIMPPTSIALPSTTTFAGMITLPASVPVTVASFAMYLAKLGAGAASV